MPFADMEAEITSAYKDAMLVLAGGRSYEEIVAAMEAFGERFLPELRARGNLDGVVEIRRMVADGCFSAAQEAGQPLDTCEILLARRLALGCVQPYDRVLRVTSFAGHCGWQGDVERARLYLIPLIEELEAEYRRTGEEVWSNSLETARQILSRIQGQRSG